MKIARLHQIEALKCVNENKKGIILLPTGTGKTFVQELSINSNLSDCKKWININYSNENSVFVILAPRIILTNQLYNEIQDLLHENHKIEFQPLIVHSGRTKEDLNYLKYGGIYRQLISTTSSKTILEVYNKAKYDNVPLIIFGTYDSADRIVNSGIPVYMLLCDEGQYLVRNEFNWICTDKFKADRKYFFTATKKETASDKGLGMNNKFLFGETIYEKTPLEMIEAGEMIRPRIHWVDINKGNESSKLDKNATAIIEAFKQHRYFCQHPKMFVVTNGSDELNDLVNHEKIKIFLNINEHLKIFDISSKFKPRINGEIVTREKFLYDLKNLKSYEEAIIFHIDILSEGIDITSMSALMILTNLGVGKFLQNFGRVTRVHPIDRNNLYKKEFGYNDLEKFVKPYAWIIVPTYDDSFGEDLKEQIKTIVYSLRKYGFNASEDVIIKDNNGHGMPVKLDYLNVKDIRNKKCKDLFIEVCNEIETEEEANRLLIEEHEIEYHIENETLEQLIKSFE